MSRHIAALLEALAASGELSADEGRITYMGNVIAVPDIPGGDDLDAGANVDFDSDGFGIEMTEHGGRRIKAIEEYKQELINNGESKFAQKIPPFHIVSPPGSINLVQNDELLEAKADEHGWSREAISNADKNIARATFQAMGGHGAFPARDYNEGNEFLSDHRAYDVQTNTADAILNLWKAAVDHWRNPSDLDFSPRRND